MANTDLHPYNRELTPKQPEFVLATSNYTKKVIMKYNIAHYYQFTAEAMKMAVIPDACIDILFWKKAGKIMTKIAGTRLEKGETDSDLSSEYFGVRFMPGVNPVSETLALSEIVNKEWDFEGMIPNYDEKERLLENMLYAKTFEDKINVFNSFYINRLNKKNENTHSLKYFLRNTIINSSGDLKLSNLGKLTGYSERYLNMKIHEDFGINPKKLIQFIRFQQAVCNLTETFHPESYADIALDSGYYDQSHFIKDFTKYSGMTPAIYLENLLKNAYNQKLHVV